MSVAALDKNQDWTFGRGRAGYKRNGAMVRQKVACRIRCFVNDWFLDIQNGINWYQLLGQKGTEDQIQREIERATLTTPGVRSIEKLEVTGRSENRALTIVLRFTTIYDDIIDEEIKVEV